MSRKGGGGGMNPLTNYASQTLKTGGRLLEDLFMKSVLSISILPSSFRKWLDLNKGLE